MTQNLCCALQKRDEPPAAREESGKEKAQKIIQKALEEAAALFAAKQKAKEAEASAAASREGTQRGGEDGGEGGGDAAQREGGGEEEGTPLLPNGGVPELQKKVRSSWRHSCQGMLSWTPSHVA
jgi:hypothetical protein